jgi:hypothetical protein
LPIFFDQQRSSKHLVTSLAQPNHLSFSDICFLGLLPQITFAILGRTNLTTFQSTLQQSYLRIDVLQNPIFTFDWSKNIPICDGGGKCLIHENDADDGKGTTCFLSLSPSLSSTASPSP